MPKISVIVPIYNSEKYLEKCLLSLINQEIEDIEILLINDGSTDKSENIISKFIKIDKRIKLLNQNNQGPGSARNNGIRNAKGDFIAFVDSDDYIDSSMLKCMYDKIVKDNSDIVICKYKKVNSLDEILFISRPENIKDDLLYQILTFDITPIACNKLYSKDLFISNEIYFPENVFYEDHLLNISLFFYVKKASFIDEAFYNWVERDNSRTESFSKKHIDDAFITLKQIKDFLIKREVYDKYENYFYLRILIILEVDIFKKLFYHNTLELAEFTIQRISDIDFSVCKIFNLGAYYNFIYNLFLLRNKYKILNIDNLVKNDSHHDFLNFALDSDNSLGLLNSLLYNIKNSGIKKAYIYSIGIDFIKIYEDVKEQIFVIDLLDNNKGDRCIKSEIFNVNDLDSIINDENEVLNFIVANINYSSNTTNYIIKFCNSKKIKYRIINFFTIEES